MGNVTIKDLLEWHITKDKIGRVNDSIDSIFKTIAAHTTILGYLRRNNAEFEQKYNDELNRLRKERAKLKAKLDKIEQKI